jgi:hypothetical protein
LAQARWCRRPLTPPDPEHLERADREYARVGVANPFVRCEPLAGRGWFEVTEHRTKAGRAGQITELADVRHPGPSGVCS